MDRTIAACLAFTLLAVPALSQNTPGKDTPRVDLSPARWDDETRAAARQADDRWKVPPVLAEGKNGVIATTSFGGTATQVGLDALAQGGSAVDAALAVALVQNVLNLGSWTSFAGIFSMVVYDAESGEVFSLDGGWNTVKAETDPLSIPEPAADEAQGRKVLVPGFMSALQAAHDRFGKLPFEALFAPAIYYAEEGFEFSEMHRFLVDRRKDVLTRFPEGRAIFTRNGELYEAGEVFRQPQLAATLRAVASQGADYMYRGAWAEKLVETLRAQGGRMTMSDLKSYRPVWREPARGGFGPYEIVGMGLPSPGGAEAIQAFQLVAEAGLDPSKHYTEDAVALEKVIRACHAALLFLGRHDEFLTDLFGDVDVSAWGRLQPEVNRAIWRKLSSPDYLRDLRAALDRRTAREQAAAHSDSAHSDAAHSDAIVVADAEGNVVALLHSINTVLWGETGIFVDGVSMADTAATQRKYLAKTGAGKRVLDSGHPFLVLRDGKPVVASSSVGRGLHIEAFQDVVNLLLYDLDPQAALLKPHFLGPFFQRHDSSSRPLDKERAYRGALSEEVIAGLAAQGREIVEIEPDSRQFIGYWAGLKIDPETGVVQASVTGDGFAAAR